MSQQKSLIKSAGMVTVLLVVSRVLGFYGIGHCLSFGTTSTKLNLCGSVNTTDDVVFSS